MPQLIQVSALVATVQNTTDIMSTCSHCECHLHILVWCYSASWDTLRFGAVDMAHMHCSNATATSLLHKCT